MVPQLVARGGEWMGLWILLGLPFRFARCGQWSLRGLCPDVKPIQVPDRVQDQHSTIMPSKRYVPKILVYKYVLDGLWRLGTAEEEGQSIKKSPRPQHICESSSAC